MTKDKVESKLRTIIAEQLGIDESEIKLTSDFIQDLACDSLDLVELLMAAEEAFNEPNGEAIYIPDEDAEKLTTVQAAVDYIAAKAA